jgi:hypothetical protein
MRYRIYTAALLGLAALFGLSGCKPPPPGGDMQGPPPFKTLDLNGDGRLTLEEFKSHAIPRGDHQDVFKMIDANGDGVVTEDEFTNHRPPMPPGR